MQVFTCVHTCMPMTVHLNAHFLRRLFALLSLVWTNELAGYTQTSLHILLQTNSPVPKFSSLQMVSSDVH